MHVCECAHVGVSLVTACACLSADMGCSGSVCSLLAAWEGEVTFILTKLVGTDMAGAGA